MVGERILDADNFLQLPIVARGDLISLALKKYETPEELIGFHTKYVQHLIAWTHHKFPDRKERADLRAYQDMAYVLAISDQVLQFKWKNKSPQRLKECLQEVKETIPLKEAS